MKYTKLVYHMTNETVTDDVTFSYWDDVQSYINKVFPKSMWYADNEEWDLVGNEIEITQHIYFVGGN